MRLVGEVEFQQFKPVSGLRKGSGKNDPLTRKANFLRCPNRSTAPLLAWDVPPFEIIGAGARSAACADGSGLVGR